MMTNLPLVARAVRYGNEQLVGVLVAGALAADGVGAVIVEAAAAIDALVGAQVRVAGRPVAGTAPFRAG